MKSKPKKRKSGRATPPLTREQLLPIAPNLAREVSLKNHMSLVALRQGQGNADIISGLLKAIYVSQYLLDSEQLADYKEMFVHTDAAINALIKTAPSTGEWRLSDADCEDVETILWLHDLQFKMLPKHKIDSANDRLIKTLDKGSFPSMSQ